MARSASSHAENRDSIRDSVLAGVDTIEHGEDLDEELCDAMVERGVILVPTLVLLGAWFLDFMPTTGTPVEHIRPEVFLHRDVDATCPTRRPGGGTPSACAQNFDMARAKGVKIALGSDTVYSPLTPHGEYSARELLIMGEFGMTPLEAISAATKTGAEALGMSHRIGLLEAGKAADLLVVEGDPSQDLQVLYDAANIRRVFSGGRLAVEDGRLTATRGRRPARPGGAGSAPLDRASTRRQDGAPPPVASGCSLARHSVASHGSSSVPGCQR